MSPLQVIKYKNAALRQQNNQTNFAIFATFWYRLLMYFRTEEILDVMTCRIEIIMIE